MNSYELTVLNHNYDVDRVAGLTFIERAYSVDLISIAVNQNSHIIMIKEHHSCFYVLQKTGELLRKFDRDYSGPPSCIGISKHNEIMIPSKDDEVICVYSEEGDLLSTTRLPEGHKIHGIAFHCFVLKTIVLTYVEHEASYFLLSYGDTGELEMSMFFCKTDGVYPLQSITSHPRGQVAVVSEKTITYI